MSLLSQVIARPERLRQLTNLQWDTLIGLARYGRVTGKLHNIVNTEGILEQIPAAARDVLVGARQYSDYMQVQTRRCLDDLSAPLGRLNCPLVLLKGAAYVMAGVPAAAGRRLNDVDLLVPEQHIDQAEQLLLEYGWAFDDELTDYDRRYYRDWSHEIPPMRHPTSPMELDLHHNIIQPTGRIKLDSRLLFDELQTLEGTGFSTLGSTDMMLHSATHLFMSDELRGGLRDLLDMHQLATDFSARDETYWQRLLERAGHLGLQRPLYYALTSLIRLFDTPIPDTVRRSIAESRPGQPADALMRVMVDRRLAPHAVDTFSAGFAERLLFVRSHWVRMPPLMLLRHLSYKWWSGVRSTES